MADEPFEEPKRPRNPFEEKKGAQARRALIIGGGEIPEGIGEILGGLFHGETNDGPLDLEEPSQNLVAQLRSLSALLAAPRNFEEGDIVRFKPGLNNTRFYGLMIVQKKLDQPIENKHEPASPYACSIEDTIIAIRVKKGHFFEYVVDGRRLEKVSEEEIALLT